MTGLIGIAVVMSIDGTTFAEGRAGALPTALVNGGFELDPGSPTGWQSEGEVGLSREGALGTRALQLTGTSNHPHAMSTQRVTVPKPWPQIVTISGLVKTEGVAHAGQGRGTAQVTVTFFDAAGKTAWGPRPLKQWSGNVPWRPWSVLARVPRTAVTLEVKLAIDGAVGTARFDDIALNWAFPDDANRENLVVDGGFEWVALPFSEWTTQMSEPIGYPGYQSRSALTITRATPGWTGASQVIRLDDAPTIHTAHIALMMLADHVEAKQAGGGAKMKLRFFDERHALIGRAAQWGPWTGTADWQPSEAAIDVPATAKTATLELFMEGATGTVRFDDVRLTASTETGQVTRRVETSNDTGAWRAFAPVETPRALPIDGRPWWHAPAGAHGFVTVRDGHFAFEDGTPARFFGVNIADDAALPTHTQAERVAARLAGMGCNLVRLHHLDAPWTDPPLFDPAHDDTQHFNPEALDRLDYFIAQLKARGIYIYLDLLVSRVFRAGDGVEAYWGLGPGAKVVALYDPRLITLQQQYARQLLTRTNAYTKTRLVDEPALALMDIVNESSLFKARDRLSSAPKGYLDELRKRWTAHLAARGVEHPERDAGRYIDAHDPAVLEFYEALETRYFQDMAASLREMGLRIPLAGSNASNEQIPVGDLAANATLDFVDRHAYWDHPKGGFGDLVRFHDTPLIDDVNAHTPVVKLSRMHVAGKPFVVSEWSIPWPDEYRAVAPILTAAYGAFQDWDGLIQFDDQNRLFANHITRNYDVSVLPEFLLQFPVAAQLFHRRDVDPAAERVAYQKLPSVMVPLGLPLVHGLDRTMASDAETPPLPTVAKHGPWVSDTKQLQWDAKAGLVLVDTPRTQAALGRIGGPPRALTDVTFEIQTPFACVTVTSLDGQPIARSGHLGVLTVARAENTGTRYNAARTMLRDPGTAPILVEPVIGTVNLAWGDRGDAEVFALDVAGQRTAPVAVERARQRLTFPVGGALAYEVVLKVPMEEQRNTTQQGAVGGPSS